LSRLRLLAVVLSVSAIAALAQGGKVKKSWDTFRLDHTRPYVYLEVDHIGPRAPLHDGEPRVGIFLRLRNNCSVPIVVDAFEESPDPKEHEIRIFDNVVWNPPMYGEPAATRMIDPMMMSHTDLSPILGTPAAAAQSPVQAPVQPPVPPQLPDGYYSLYGSSMTIKPGQSIYFSLPRNHVSETWHAEVFFRFDLKTGAFRSPYNFVAVYLDDLSVTPKHSEGRK
jgi:hypothetical protein